MKRDDVNWEGEKKRVERTRTKASEREMGVEVVDLNIGGRVKRMRRGGEEANGAANAKHMMLTSK